MTATSRARTTHRRGRLFDSVIDTVGDTPCIRVDNVAPYGVRLYVKAEAFDPASSGDMDDDERAISQSTPGYRMP
jgi:cysteine synthase A